MKTLGQISPRTIPLAVAVSLVLFSGEIYAGGPAGGVAVGSQNGTNTGAASVGFSGVTTVGAGRANAAPAPAVSGPRPAVSFSNNNAASRGAGVRGNNNAASRGAGVRGNGVPSGLSAPYRSSLNTGGAPAASRFIASPSVSRPANAWSGLAARQANGNNPNAAVRNGARPPIRNGSNNWTANGTANGFTGQRLDAGAPGANLPSYNRGDRGNRNGNFRYRFNGRPYSYYPYAYGPAYAPYISYFGGYYGGAYPYYNDIPAADTQFSSGATTVSPQYVEQAPANSQPDAEAQPDANVQPAPQRQQPPADANGGTIPGNGPDSLVEAVQEELVRRGYYGGKVDAMFNADTKESLRKFQTDHHLASTGLINEATLHALQLD